MKGLKAFLKFVPVFVLAGLMIFGKGHLFDGQDAMIAAPLAFLAAVIIAMLVEKKKMAGMSGCRDGLRQQHPRCPVHPDARLCYG